MRDKGYVALPLPLPRMALTSLLSPPLLSLPPQPPPLLLRSPRCCPRYPYHCCWPQLGLALTLMLGTPVVPTAAVLWLALHGVRLALVLHWCWCCIGIGTGTGVCGFNKEGGRGGWERARQHLAEFQTPLKSH